MTAAPHQRISQAAFSTNRQYFLALDNGVVYVYCDRDRDLSVKSTLTADQRPLATEWVVEVARDLAKAYGGSPRDIYKLIALSL